MVGDVHVMASVPGALLRLQVVSPAERAHRQVAARESVHFEAERRQVERSAVGGAAIRASEKVSLSSMPSYKRRSRKASQAVAAIRSVGLSAATTGTAAGAALNGGAGHGTPLGAPFGTPGKKPLPRNKEKKPQASSTPVAPAATPAAVVNAARLARCER